MNQHLNIPCANCGAVLSLPKNSRFVSCKKCNTALKIRRNGTVIYTEILKNGQQQAPSSPSPQPANHQKRRQLVEELAVLERSWMNELEQHKVNGQLPHVMYKGGIANNLFAILLGIGAIALGISMSITDTSLKGAYVFLPIGVFSCIGLIFISIGGYGLSTQFSMKKNYDQAFAKYQLKRQSLEQELKKIPPIK